MFDFFKRRKNKKQENVVQSEKEDVSSNNLAEVKICLTSDGKIDMDFAAYHMYNNPDFVKIYASFLWYICSGAASDHIITKLQQQDNNFFTNTSIVLKEQLNKSNTNVQSDMPVVSPTKVFNVGWKI